MEGRPSKEQIEFWIVVCTELHFAAGPFVSLAIAVQRAAQMSQEHACVFLPVPLVETDLEVVSVQDIFGKMRALNKLGGDKKKDEEEEWRGPGQYL